MDYIRIDGKAELRSYLQDFAESRRYIMAVDIEAEGKPGNSDTLAYIHDKKTAALFRAAGGDLS